MDDDYFRILLEYMPAGSVAAMLRMIGPLKEAVARFYTSQILQGIAFLHSCGLVHRDIKPANLLLGVRGNLKVRAVQAWCPDFLSSFFLALWSVYRGFRAD
jgi:mitogen-activated protein kinase kinase kinase